MLESIWSFGGWGVSLTRPVLESVRQVRSLSIIRPVLESVWPLLGWGFSRTRHVLEAVWLYVGWGICLTRPFLASVSSFGGWGVSLTRPVLESLRRVRSFSYLYQTGICLVVRQVGTLSLSLIHI